MATPHGPDKVLAQVASRLRWARYGHRLSRLVLWTSIVAAVVVLVVRLTGLFDLPADPVVTTVAGVLGEAPEAN